MAATVHCQCGNIYQLKDEYAGREVTCPKCGTVNTAEAAPVPRAVGDPAFDRDKFLLRQKALAIKEKYYVWDDAGQTILYVERPAYVFRGLLAILAGLAAGLVVFGGLVVLAGLAGEGALGVALALFSFVGGFAALLTVGIALSPKRHVTFYRDDTQSERVLEVLQDRKVQIPTVTYTVRDCADGKVLAHLRKNYLYNLFRKQWRCLTPGGAVLCVAKEDSIILSLLRRVLGPFFGLLRTNFIILRGGDTVIGEFNRKFTLLDRYVLDLTRDPRRLLDRRVALALGVMLDTGERR